MKRSGKLVLNALTILSLMLSAAVTAIWVDHQVRTQPGRVIRPCMQLEVSLEDVTPGLLTSRTVDVDLSGRVELPLLGKMKAGGLTCAQLEAKMNQAFLDAGVIKSVTVFVRIVGLRPPGGLLVSLLLTIPTVRVLGYCWSSLKLRRRLAAGLCPHCGYDVRATPHRCPECGTAPRETA